jgi:hypothetical protein
LARRYILVTATIFWLLVFGNSLGSLCGLAANTGNLGPKTATERDLNLLQGKWALKTYEIREKNSISVVMPKTFTGALVIAGNRATSRVDMQGEELEYSFRLVLDSTKDPKHWDEIVTKANVPKKN